MTLGPCIYCTGTGLQRHHPKITWLIDGRGIEDSVQNSISSGHANCVHEIVEQDSLRHTCALSTGTCYPLTRKALPVQADVDVCLNHLEWTDCIRRTILRLACWPLDERIISGLKIYCMTQIQRY